MAAETALPDGELVALCRAIVAEGLTVDQWAAVESDDWFQTERYRGGFDADERAFCFEMKRKKGVMLFQLSLDDVNEIAIGRRIELALRAG